MECREVQVGIGHLEEGDFEGEEWGGKEGRKACGAVYLLVGLF